MYWSGLVTLNDMKAKQEALVKEREKQLAKKEQSKELQLWVLTVTQQFLVVHSNHMALHWPLPQLFGVRSCKHFSFLYLCSTSLVKYSIKKLNFTFLGAQINYWLQLSIKVFMSLKAPPHIAQTQTNSQLPLSDHSVASGLTLSAEKLHWNIPLQRAANFTVAWMFHACGCNNPPQQRVALVSCQ